MPKDEIAPTVNELEILAAVPRRVQVYTLKRDEKNKPTKEQVVREVVIAPMTLDICGECAAAMRPIAESLGIKITLDMLPLLVSDHYKSVRAMVAIATEEPPEYIGTLPLDQFLKLTTAVWEVNQDFFVHHVGPIAKTLAEKMFSTGGPTSSTSSPPTVTPTP